MVRAEYLKQWVTLNWYLIFGILSFAGVIGIALLVYAIIQQQALRRRVAEAGDDPEQFARDGNKLFAPGFTLALSIIGVIIVICFILTMIFNATHPQPMPTPKPTPYCAPYCVG